MIFIYAVSPSLFLYRPFIVCFHSHRMHALQQVVDGVKVYFNRALPKCLLYRFERPQYDDIIRQWPQADMTTMYGAEHLLRLLGNIFCLFRYVFIFSHKNGLFVIDSETPESVACLEI